MKYSLTVSSHKFPPSFQNTFAILLISIYYILQYYFEVTQAEIWVKEKMTQVSSCDSCYDIYSVQVCGCSFHIYSKLLLFVKYLKVTFITLYYYFRK